MKIKNLTGLKFGKLTVLNRSEDYISPKGKHTSRWLCLCDCGETTITASKNLTCGDTKSCGCLVRETNSTHRMTGTREYTSWVSMRSRCTNPNNIDYPAYGGRGITVCERWKTFENFYEDMGERPQYSSIERINNDGNYEPSNCKWASAGEQAKNKRKSQKPYVKRLNTSSSYVGVSLHKPDNKWCATITINRKCKYLGLFNTEIEASNAYQAARLNFQKSKEQ